MPALEKRCFGKTDRGSEEALGRIYGDLHLLSVSKKENTGVETTPAAVMPFANAGSDAQARARSIVSHLNQTCDHALIDGIEQDVERQLAH